MFYELVDSVCSQYKVIDEDSAIIHPKLPSASDLTSLSDYTCVNIFEHNDTSAKFLLDLTNLTFLNKWDNIMVLDGVTRDSHQLFDLEHDDLDINWRQSYIYTTSNKIRILYESWEVNNTKPTEQNNFGIIPVSQGMDDIIVPSHTNYRSPPFKPVGRYR